MAWRGSWRAGCCRLLQADVFVPITPGPIDILKKAGMIGSAVPVASTQMVIAYSPKSKFVPDFEAAAQGKKNPDYALSSAIGVWYKTGTYGCFCGLNDGAQQGAIS